MIYNADCRKVLPFLGRFDLLLTDPPYGIGEDGKRSNRNRKGDDKWKNPTNKDYGDNNWDNEPVEGWVLGQSICAAAKSIIFGGNYYDLPPAKMLLIWDKQTDGKNGSDCEIAWTNLGGTTKRFKWLWDGFRMEKNENRTHPTQKPLPLMRWSLSLVPDAKMILDPFMGSGTTLLAAKLEGRRAVGIELNEKYCESAAKRLEQGVLF